MAVSFIRTIILYFLIIFAVRTTGKRQIGQLSPAELVITILMSELAVIPMEDLQKPLVAGIIPILTLVIFEFTISLITLKSFRIRNFLNGRPIVIIENSELNQDNMKKIKMSIDELCEQLRTQGIFDLRMVEYAVMEKNGTLSVLQKEKFQPLSESQKDPAEQKLDTVPTLLVSDGVLLDEGLKKAGINRKEFQKLLEKKKITSYKDIFYMTYLGAGEYDIIMRQSA